MDEKIIGHKHKKSFLPGYDYTEVRIESYSMYDTFPLWGRILMWISVLFMFFSSIYLAITSI